MAKKYNYLVITIELVKCHKANNVFVFMNGCRHSQFATAFVGKEHGAFRIGNICSEYVDEKIELHETRNPLSADRTRQFTILYHTGTLSTCCNSHGSHV